MLILKPHLKQTLLIEMPVADGVHFIHLQFFAPNRSICLVNVVCRVFVTTFLKKFLLFVMFVHLYKKTPYHL